VRRTCDFGSQHFEETLSQNIAAFVAVAAVAVTAAATIQPQTVSVSVSPISVRPA